MNVVQRHLAALLFVICSAVAPALVFARQSSPEVKPDHLPDGMARYESKYYVIYTDIPPQDAQEVAQRVTKMAETYASRTREWSGSIRQRLPFYLFRNHADYVLAGGPEKTAGVFLGTRLMGVAGERLDENTWHVIQHEGFHQFARLVMRGDLHGDLPTWCNEGIADYFGEALFTGDGFVTGIIPQFRLVRVRDAIRTQRFRPMGEMLRMTYKEWNADVTTTNYDQGWSMFHFLAHGDDGCYQSAFAGYMMDLGRGVAPADAWSKRFGDDEKAFQRQYEQWWLSLPDNPTIAKYQEALTATFASFLARAAAEKQTFSTFEQFTSTARAGLLRAPKEDPLPATLLANALDDADEFTKTNGMRWAIDVAHNRSPQIVCIGADGSRRMFATFKVRDSHVESVTTTTLSDGAAAKSAPRAGMRTWPR